ncbi:MAG: type I 3-dehydroquinate dehydratase [Planctomycetota bacterium]|nr:type I 3-dehydroquinate dehydratase [Planctomycetota bacterium]
MSDAHRPTLPLWLNVVTAAPPAVTKPEDLAAIAGCADLIELRFDLLGVTDPADVAAWVTASPRSVIATVRSEAEGGRFAGTSDEALALLRAAAQAGARAIDLEPSMHGAAYRASGAVVIRSSHTWEDADRAGGGFRKRAVPVDTPDQLERAQHLSRHRGFVVPYGAMSCLRGTFATPSHAQGLLFGAAAVDSPAAEGQPPLCALLDELRAGEVHGLEQHYGLVGTPPAWSPSPAMHNSVFRRENRGALYVPIGRLSPRDAMGFGFNGFSVTTPFKGEAFDVATEHDASAKRTGIVNTLVRRDDHTWLGLDTDSRAIGSLIGRARPPETGAFVYGAGGYARAAAATLSARGYDVRLGARNAERGKALADDIGLPFAGTVYIRDDADSVFFNATPAGAVDDDVSFLGDALLHDLVVFDAPYRDGGPTALVARAEENDARAIVEGRTLLLEQAVHQARAFGSRLDEDELRLVMGLGLRPPPNLWLVGLRGSGKSSVGALVARRLGRPFVDLDQELTRVTGHTPASFIAAEGWDAFRAKEAALFERVRHRRGIVVATGGGLIETGAAYEQLRALPCVAYLHVAPATAAARVAEAETERPRLPGVPPDADESMVAYERRDPRYRAVATFRIEAEGAREDVVRATTRGWLAVISDLLANNVEA